MTKYRGCNWCQHFRPDGSCLAFYPDPIPLPIASGSIKHTKPLFKQKNQIVYEPATEHIVYRLDFFREQERQVLDKIEIVEGDITQLDVDAIVNAANESLIAGGGVSGAIHRAAGLGLEKECLKLGICNEGEAKITQGYNLKARWVIHTVGPVWEGGDYNEEQTLRNCYSNSLKLAKSYGIKTIAFPAISTGIYEFPLDKATSIAINTVKLFLEQNNSIEKVVFVCFESQVYGIYQECLKQAFPLTYRYRPAPASSIPPQPAKEK